MPELWLPAETTIKVTLEDGDVVDVQDELKMIRRPVGHGSTGFAGDIPSPPSPELH